MSLQAILCSLYGALKIFTGWKVLGAASAGVSEIVASRGIEAGVAAVTVTSQRPVQGMDSGSTYVACPSEEIVG